jgi:hypothetical protein
MTRAEYEAYVAFVERNSDADLTLHVESGSIYAHHRHWEMVNERIQVVERFDEWHPPKERP